MLVHAHPDDETIGNGVTMARYAAEGAGVSLVTCTLGEEGEVLVPELEHLGAEHDDNLGPTRLAELGRPWRRSGITDFVRLGGDYRFRDSGMAYDDQRRAVARDVLRDGIFWTADLLEADERAGAADPRPRGRTCWSPTTRTAAYGHPDHVQAHRVAMYGYVLAGVPSYRPDLGEPWSVPRVLWNTMSRTRLREAVAPAAGGRGHRELRGLGPGADERRPGSRGRGHRRRDHAARARRGEAGRDAAHATQITEDGPFFAAAPVLGDAMWSHEFYVLAAGQPLPNSGTENSGWADDVFAGLE